MRPHEAPELAAIAGIDAGSLRLVFGGDMALSRAPAGPAAIERR